jgi:hypothetical protein
MTERERDLRSGHEPLEPGANLPVGTDHTWAVALGGRLWVALSQLS